MEIGDFQIERRNFEMKTIIFAHPYSESFNKAILDNIVQKLNETKEKYTIIDLNKDEFNPVMTEEE